MANFAAQLKDRFFGLVDRVAGCGRAGVREETTKSAPAPAVQELRDVFYDLVERVTGYSARAEDDKGGGMGGFMGYNMSGGMGLFMGATGGGMGGLMVG
uniref:Uncharacterized protein n=1 Tax=Aegilops tauschii TaxID=37682 RepID=M8BSF6_AEGTA